jgi:hypothetical protein
MMSRESVPCTVCAALGAALLLGALDLRLLGCRCFEFSGPVNRSRFECAVSFGVQHCTQWFLNVLYGAAFEFRG